MFFCLIIVLNDFFILFITRLYCFLKYTSLIVEIIMIFGNTIFEHPNLFL